MKQQNRRVVITKDGSPTLFVPELNEHYHSIHGAVQESQHVFIESGLNYLLKKGIKNIRVFEVGFGTGINAWLSMKFAEENDLNINYESIEAYPLDMFEAESIASGLLDNDKKKNEFLQLHELPWEKENQLSKHFKLFKREGILQEYKIDDNADLIYFDAFAPNKQAELWEKPIFDMMIKLLKPDGILVTYCAKGIVKRTMKAAGFEVETIAGPPGKREMIRAHKPK